MRLQRFANSPSGQTIEWQALVRRGIVHLTSTLERHLSPHCECIELGTRVAEVGGTDLLGNVAVKVVEHHPDVAVGVPVQRHRIDRLSPARDAVGLSELIVEINGTEPTGDLPRAPAATLQ